MSRREKREFWNEVHQWRCFIKEEGYTLGELKAKHLQAIRKRSNNLEWLEALKLEIKSRELKEATV